MKLPSFAIILIGLLLATCTSTKDIAAKATCDDFKNPHITKEIKVADGKNFTLTLCSNPTTGFSWETPHISDPDIVQVVSHQFIAPSFGTAPPAGAPGSDMWTFRTVAKGTVTIANSYSRPWEGGEKGARTFNLTVTVK